MKRILIYKQIIKNGEYDICHSIDYDRLFQTVKQKYSGISPNWANRLWLQGIYSEIYTQENQYDFFSNDMSCDYINVNYDLIILPMANIFWVGHKKALERLSAIFEQIHIPTFVIACGVQADSYDDLEMLIENLREPASRFITAIYNTGGEFALRGYFTKEFFDKLGFRSAVVTGCPSLFQCGRSLAIHNQCVEAEQFKVAFNGRMEGVAHLLFLYPKSEYFDQHNYFDLIYCRDILGNGGKKALKSLVIEHGFDAVLLAAELRLNLFPDMREWYHYLREQKFNFSFGSRIHGNVMSVLSGIPSVVWTCDSRTREMAEFFDIPYVRNIPKDIYKCYLDADYTKFNASFKHRFDDFEKFLCCCGICERVNEKNSFFDLNSSELEIHRKDSSNIPSNTIETLLECEKWFRMNKKYYDTVNYIISKVKRILR